MLKHIVIQLLFHQYVGLNEYEFKEVLVKLYCWVNESQTSTTIIVSHMVCVQTVPIS